MDYLGEAIALTIDSIVLVVCVNQYIKNKNAITMVQGAPVLDLDDNLKEIVTTHPQQRLSFVCVRGIVEPIGNPIISINNAKVKGVVQFLSIKEHVMQRTSTGFWSSHERTIQEVQNVMPFKITSSFDEVEIADPLAADILDMDVISDVFSASSPTVMDHIWGFFAGVRQRGIQTTEKMLRNGTIITGIGELVYATDGKTLRLQRPSNGAPYYLTNMPITSLIRKLEHTRKIHRIVCVAASVAGVVIGGLMVMRYWRERTRKREELNRRRELEAIRAHRRRNNTDSPLLESQTCVVCKDNPKEIILLPCGHFCLCGDCSEQIHDSCPICRARIQLKSIAYT